MAIQLTLNKKTIIIILIAAAAVFGITRIAFRDKPREAKPKTEKIVEAVYSMGTVKARNEYCVKIGSGSQITKLYVREGSSVQPGTPLLTTDSGVTITSKMKGTVTVLSVNEYEFAESGKSLMAITDMSDFYVLASTDQESILHVRPGQNCELSFENLRAEKIQGAVESVYSSEDLFIIKISARLPQGVMPGMTCDLAIKTGERNALLVPKGSVINGRITVIRGGKKQIITVKSAPFNGESTEITDGSVKQDDLIIVAKTNPDAGKEFKK